MKNNREILNEAFFKKQSHKDKLRSSLPQYEPVKAGETPSYEVTDTAEVKRRLAGTFGAAFGSNSIKSMASKSIKQFPIIISDNVEPETVVMLKKLMEEQYAEYINLLVSNQVIDLSAYEAGSENGNIAIQALDTISGTNFNKSRLANKAYSGNISADDIFANTPLYTLLRENKVCFVTGDSLIDTLFEGACIVPSEDADKVVKYITENASEIAVLNEIGPTSRVDEEDNPHFRVDGNDKKKNNGKTTLANYLSHLDYPSDDQADKNFENIVANRERNLDLIRGFRGLDKDGKEIYTKLTSADIVLDQKRMDQAMNRSVGELLSQPENAIIKDKFEKATWLLQARRIAGIEYIQYLTLRLGIPVSEAASKELLSKFKIGDIRDYSRTSTKKDTDNNWHLLNKDDVDNIAANRKVVGNIVREIAELKVGDYVKNGVVTSILGTGVGAGIAAGLAGIAAAPLIIGALIGAVVGGGTGLLLSKFKDYRIKKFNTKATANRKIEGWERVEALIEDLERRRAELLNPRSANTLYHSVIDDSEANKNHKDLMDRINKRVNSGYDNITALSNIKSTDYEDSFKTVSTMVDKALREAIEYPSNTKKNCVNAKIISETTAYLENLNDDLIELSEELSKDNNFMTEMLVEATLGSINTLDRGPKPVQVKYVETKPGQSAMLANPYGARASLAYGSTEIERRDNKDRRFDQPLIMTVKFKERYSDGKFADNELTAVIGILGKVIRVPSEEMEYILAANTEGDTIEGLFKSAAGGDLKNTISDILSTSKISRELKSLPQSGDMWHNLEKVTTLAAANKITGKRNNNLANAHIVFDQREIDRVRQETGVNYLKDIKKTVSLMKRYSAFTLMIANDAGQRVNIFDDQDNISWNVVPYTALVGKDNGDQLNAVLTKLKRTL